MVKSTSKYKLRYIYLVGVTTGCGHLTDQQSSVETFVDQGIKRCFKAGSSDQEPILAIKNFDRRRSWKYRAYCSDYPLLFLLIPHTKGSIECNTVLIHRNVRAVGTFLLYFCISLCKDTSKYQYYFFCKRGYPTHMHTSDIIGSSAFI